MDHQAELLRRKRRDRNLRCIHHGLGYHQNHHDHGDQGVGFPSLDSASWLSEGVRLEMACRHDLVVQMGRRSRVEVQSGRQTVGMERRVDGSAQRALLRVRKVDCAQTWTLLDHLVAIAGSLDIRLETDHWGVGGHTHCCDNPQVL